MIKDETIYHIFVDGDRARDMSIYIHPDMKIAIKAECEERGKNCDIYLYSLEPVDANKKGVENQNK